MFKTLLLLLQLVLASYTSNQSVKKTEQYKKENEIITNSKKQILTRKLKENKKTNRKPSVKKENKRVLIWFDTKSFKFNKSFKELIYLAFKEEAGKAKGKYIIVSKDTKNAKNKTKQSVNFLLQIKITPMFKGKNKLLSARFSHIETALGIATSSLKYHSNKKRHKAFLKKIKKFAHKFFQKIDNKISNNKLAESYKLKRERYIKKKRERYMRKKRERYMKKKKNLSNEKKESK